MEYRSKKPPFFVPRSKEGGSIWNRLPFATAMGGGPNHKWVKVLKRVLKWAAIGAAFALAAGILFGAVLFAWVSRDLPDPNRLVERESQRTTKIWDRTGEHLLYEIHGAQKRTIVKLEDVSTHVIHAAIASEDRNFYEHKGVRLRSFVRAIIGKIFQGKRLQATTTITQQVVKNVILTNERTLTRKMKEVILAYQIERRFTKNEILQMYFNETPYGSTAYGIESAAQMYFAKSAKELDAAEGALLAALVPAPSRLSPYGSNKEELLSRWQHVLDAMREEGYLTSEELEAAKAVDVLARVQPRRDVIEAPHFSLYVKELLAEKYGERMVEEGGLNVITTLDYDKQKIAEEAVKNGMEAVKTYGGSNASLVSTDPKTGQVLAMVGSADYFDEAIDGNVNVALRKRQPGSSFKPIVYAAAFEKGYTPNTVVFDVQTKFPTDGGRPYEPKNYDLSEHGPVTLKKALAGSLNIPAVKALYLVGIARAIDFAENLGYSTLQDRSRFGLSLVLGGAEVKLIEHVSAYGVFASEGTYRAPAVILKVQDAAGETLEEWKDEPKEKILSVEAVRNLSNVLSDNSARAYVFGEKNYLTLPGRPVAAKTGTTNSFVDAWAMGYTPNLVTGVWVGNNDSTEMKSRADGSRVAAPIWNEYMRRALENAPVENFVAPEPIVTGKPVLDGQAGEITVKIDRFTGMLATEETPPTAVIEKTFRQAHDILYYVDKDDPRGPYPADPVQDPQFVAWEEAVLAWAQKNGWQIDEAPPTEADSLHDDAFKPNISFEVPSDNAVISGRTFQARVQASAPRGVSRVEYRLDGVLLGTATAIPWEAALTLPATYGRGFYTLKATAYDDIEHNASQDIAVNVQSDGIEMRMSWSRPSSDVTYRQRNFPIYIDAAVADHVGVSSVDIVAQAVGKEEQVTIGTLSNPVSNGVSVSWDQAPAAGTYQVVGVVHLSTGASLRFDGPKITVKP